MSEVDDEHPPSLMDRAIAWLRPRGRHLPSPASYGTALTILALLPGATALLACGMAAWHDHGRRTLARDHADRIAMIVAAQADAERRIAIAPFVGAPTLTAALAAVSGWLTPDATLHAISRDGDGEVRMEIDCPDPDALLSAVRSSALPWRAVAQSVAEGNGVRVTLATRMP